MFLLNTLVALLAVCFASGDVTCPDGLTNVNGQCCNSDGVCCPDLPSGICCTTGDSDLCCGANMQMANDLDDGLKAPECCVGENCCPAGGFSLQNDGQCCSPAGICCELGANDCTCESGMQIQDTLDGNGNPLSDGYTPNGCGAETWCADAQNFVNLLTPMWSQSCEQHDRCYVDCMRTQSDCDEEFKVAMHKECEDYWQQRIRWRWARRMSTRLCRRAADFIFTLIKPTGGQLGGPAYRQGRQEYCTCPKSFEL